MKREILFRGKRSDSTDWIEGYLLQSKSFGEDYKTNIQTKEHLPVIYKIKPETVGQFTGKYDKNGKMIFEGDIVRGNNYVKQEKTYVSAIAEIAYCNDRAEFILKEFHSWVNGKVYSSCNISLNYLSDMEVIGNIYDNPELLESV